MLFHCWLSVLDGGPALEHHWDNVSMFAGNVVFSRPHAVKEQYPLMFRVSIYICCLLNQMQGRVHTCRHKPFI